MNPPQNPVRPPQPPQVPSDHIVDANKMETPRTDAHFSSHPQDMHPHITPDFARQLERELAAANVRLADLEQWIRSLDAIEANSTEHRRWCGEIGWLYPGQCVFVGADKPEGPR